VLVVELPFREANRAASANDPTSAQHSADFRRRDEAHLDLKSRRELTGVEGSGQGGRQRFVQHRGQHPAVNKACGIDEFGTSLHVHLDHLLRGIEFEEPLAQQLRDRCFRGDPL
jgi:hypothetical protein